MSKHLFLKIYFNYQFFILCVIQGVMETQFELPLWPENHLQRHLPELELSKKAVEMSQCILHAVRVRVEISQGLVSGDVPHLLQAPCQVFRQGPHCYALDLPVHDDGAGSQTLCRNTRVTNHLCLVKGY